MSTFVVNGHTVTAEKNKKLLRFLRDDLGLTSVKDGCSEGACGTCHVLIDGKPTKACIPQTDKLEGKTILTVEGLTDWEKQVYTFAFGEAGAVQCGFCIPGMVISAKGLLDVNPADELLVLFYGNGSAVHGKCGHSRSLLRALCTIFHGNNTIPPTQKQDGNAREADADVIVVGE